MQIMCFCTFEIALFSNFRALCVVKEMMAPLIIGMVPNVPRKSENLYNCRNQEKMMKMVTPKCWWWFGRSSERVWSEKINF